MLGPGTYRDRDQDTINIEVFRNHTHTHPTKFVFALLASHVTGRVSLRDAMKEWEDLLATTILLDSTLTFATFLGIAFDPVCRFTVITALLQPHLCDCTQHRSMVAVDVATKAELVFRIRPTRYRWDNSRQCGARRRSWTRDTAIAGRVWTILEVLVTSNIIAN